MTATPAMQAPMLAFAPVERLDFEVGAGVEVGEAGEVVWDGDVEVGVGPSSRALVSEGPRSGSVAGGALVSARLK